MTPNLRSIDATQFQFPLDVYFYLLRELYSDLPYLHYGLFEQEDTPIEVAQKRSTDIVLSELPASPLSVLEVGIGLGKTAKILEDKGYSVTGVTPDPQQIDIAEQQTKTANFHLSGFEDLDIPDTFDVVLFQESSQYIPLDQLFEQITRYLKPRGHLIILDEYRLKTTSPGHLHLAQTVIERFNTDEWHMLRYEDYGLQAVPTLDFLFAQITKLQNQIKEELDVTEEQICALNESNLHYKKSYQNGDYGYLLMHWQRK